MTGPVRGRLSDGRPHFQHGPIDLVIAAQGDDRAVAAAVEAAWARFATLLAELCGELAELRTPVGPGHPGVAGPVARRMLAAARPHGEAFVTPMAAVAGAVADAVLAEMTAAAPLARCAVNDGGDIALALAPGERFRAAVADHRAVRLATVDIGAADGIGGIATSGRHGRSHSLGIADSVTVLARDAAAADVAATLVANAVDLPAHPGIERRPARALAPDSDLGDRPVVVACAPLSPAERARALEAGVAAAEAMAADGRLVAAFLHLQGETRLVGRPGLLAPPARRAA